MSWEDATHAWAEQSGADDGFYVQVGITEFVKHLFYFYYSFPQWTFTQLVRIVCHVYHIVAFISPGKEQQEDCYLGERGEPQEEAVPGLQAQHREAAQAGDLHGYQEEV